MCENADKTVHLETLISEIKTLYAQWQKARNKRLSVKTAMKTPVKPTTLLIR